MEKSQFRTLNKIKKDCQMSDGGKKSWKYMYSKERTGEGGGGGKSIQMFWIHRNAFTS